MDISEALKSDKVMNIRLRCGNKVMYWDSSIKEWVIRDQSGRRNVVIFTSEHEDLATDKLIEGNVIDDNGSQLSI